MKRSVLMIAHRAGNNLKSLEKAIENNSVDAIECDVWFTKEGKFAVRHGKKYLPFILFTIERWQGRLRLIIAFRELWLEEVIKKAASRQKTLVIDVKGSYNKKEAEELARKLAKLIWQFLYSHLVIIDSKDLAVLKAVHEAAAQCSGGPHLRTRLSIQNRLALNTFLSLKKEDTAFLYGVIINKKILSRRIVLGISKQNKRISANTINSEQEALNFIAIGATGICSDDLNILEKLKRRWGRTTK